MEVRTIKNNPTTNAFFEDHQLLMRGYEETMKKIQFTYVKFFVLAFVLIGLMQANGLLAQSSTIEGTVKDETDAVLPGVSITTTHLETNQSRTVISDDQGVYQVPQLPSGTYEVQAELSGFSTGVRSSISLTMDSRAVVNFSLSIGQLTERVVVTGEAALVDTTSAVTSGLVDARQMRDLPLNGRDIVQLALLQEGIVPITKYLTTQGGNDGILISMAGARVHQNAFLLDGTDIRGARGVVPAGAGGAVAGVESIKEFKVLTGAFSAEYGEFTGGVITAITKSGTNDIHGSIYDYHRNAAVDARNFFDRDPTDPLNRSKVPQFTRNQFGFSLGGPIVKDKTFIFGALEVLRVRQSLNPGSDGGFVFTDQVRAGQFPDSNGNPIPVDPDVQPYFDIIPLQNGRDLGGGIGEYFNPEHYPTDGELITIRVDHQFSDADSFFARYTLDQSEKTFFWSNQADLNNVYRYQYLTMAEKHIFSPNVINEVRFGFVRSLSNQLPVESPPEGTTIDPGLRFSNLDPPYGPTIPQWLGVPIGRWGSFLGAKQVPNNFSYSDDLNWTKGSHFLKIGGLFKRMQMNGKSTTNSNGLYTGAGVAAILQKQFARLSWAAFNNVDIGIRQNLFALYIQDDWKFAPRFTINMGVRYEGTTSPTEVGNGEYLGADDPGVEGRLANLLDPADLVQHLGNPLWPENPSLKNFSPRIGFAWDIFGTGKTSLRAGFGLFHQQLTRSLYSTGANNAPFNVGLTIAATRIRGQIPPGGGPPMGLNIEDELVARAEERFNTVNMGTPKQPYMMQYTLTLQQEIMPNTVLTIGYQGSGGRKIPRMMNDANIFPQTKYDASLYPNGPGPEFNGRTYFPFCTAYSPSGDFSCPRGNDLPREKLNPNFGVIRTQLWDGNSNYNALRISLARRFSAGLAFQFSYNYSKAIDEGSNSTHSDANEGNLANSSWMVVDRFDKASMRGTSSNHVGQTFSGTFSYVVPYNPQGAAGLVLGGWSFNGILTLATGPTTSFSMDWDRSGMGQGTASERPELKPGFSNNPILDDGREPTAYYDVNAFSFAPQGFLGDLGRNTLTLGGVATFDLGMTKDWALTEGAKLQFKTEIFNIANRANFGIPGMELFGRGGVPDPTAGIVTKTTTTSRQIQFALKIVF